MMHGTTFFIFINSSDVRLKGKNLRSAAHEQAGNVRKRKNRVLNFIRSRHFSGCFVSRAFEICAHQVSIHRRMNAMHSN